jgi:hypothetical protein
MITKSPLRNIAHSRSGDKGIHANVGVIAYTKEAFEFLSKELTQERVEQFFKDKFPDSLKGVKRYELSNLLSFNFVLEGILGEGGSLSLRTDAQGKVLGQVMLELLLPIPKQLLEGNLSC